jgi:hypothetical protein
VTSPPSPIMAAARPSGAECKENLWLDIPAPFASCAAAKG